MLPGVLCCIGQVKDYDRKRQRAEKALEARDWAEAERAFIEALNVRRAHRGLKEYGARGVGLGLAAREQLGRR